MLRSMLMLRLRLPSLSSQSPVGPSRALLGLILVVAVSGLGACSAEDPAGEDPTEPGTAAATGAGAEAEGSEAPPNPHYKQKNVRAAPLPAFPDVVAEVNGEPIRRLELEDLIIDRNEAKTFARLTLLWQEAMIDSLKRRDLEVTEAEIDRTLEDIVMRAGMTDVEELMEVKLYDRPYLRRQVAFRVGCEELAYHEGLVPKGSPVTTGDPRIIAILEKENDIEFRSDGIPDDAYAVVNGRTVPQSAMLEWSIVYVGPEEAAKLLEELIDRELDTQLIKAAGIDPKGLEVLVGTEKRFQSFDELESVQRRDMARRGVNWERVLAGKGETVADWRERLWVQAGRKELIAREATEAMLLRYLEENRDQLGFGEKFLIARCPVEIGVFTDKGATEEEARQQARARIEEAKAASDAGRPFTQVVADFTTVPQLRDSGGEDAAWITWYQKHDTVFREVASRLEVGQVSEPFEYRSAWYIIQLVRKMHPAAAEFILKKEKNRQFLLERMTTYAPFLWRDEKKKSADIERHVDL